MVRNATQKKPRETIGPNEGRPQVTDKTTTNPVALAAREFSRRALLKTSVVAGAGAITAPWIVKNAFSSSGEVNFVGWAGYDFKELFAAFTAKTGIKMNFVEQPDND